jgi:hypothetical protein
MHRILKIGLTVTGVFAVLLAVFAWVNPFTFWLLLGSLFFEPGAPPPLAVGQISEMQGRPIDDPKWTDTLRKMFPPGTEEARLIAVLREQRFSIDRTHRTAEYRWEPSTVCTDYLWVG